MYVGLFPRVSDSVSCLSASEVGSTPRSRSKTKETLLRLFGSGEVREPVTIRGSAVATRGRFSSGTAVAADSQCLAVSNDADGSWIARV